MKHGKLPLSLVIPLIFAICIYTSTGPESFRRDGKYNTVNLAYFVNNPSHRLNGAVLVSFMVLSPIECAYQCIHNQDCYSFNFAATLLDGRHSCELLNTDKFLNSEDLVCHDGFDHYNSKVRVKRFCSLTIPACFSFVKYSYSFWIICRQVIVWKETLLVHNQRYDWLWKTHFEDLTCCFRTRTHSFRLAKLSCERAFRNVVIFAPKDSWIKVLHTVILFDNLG